MSAEALVPSSWMPLMLILPVLIVLLIRMAHYEHMRETAENTLKAERIYSKWLRERLAEQTFEGDLVVQHIVLPKGPVEDV